MNLCRFYWLCLSHMQSDNYRQFKVSVLCVRSISMPSDIYHRQFKVSAVLCGRSVKIPSDIYHRQFDVSAVLCVRSVNMQVIFIIGNSRFLLFCV